MTSLRPRLAAFFKTTNKMATAGDRQTYEENELSLRKGQRNHSPHFLAPRNERDVSIRQLQEETSLGIDCFLVFYRRNYSRNGIIVLLTYRRNGYSGIIIRISSSETVNHFAYLQQTHTYINIFILNIKLISYNVTR